MIRVVVQEDDFDTGLEIQRLGQRSLGVGGISTFVGLVRDENDGKGVRSLFLEHYPSMTEKQIETIIDEAQSRWKVIAATVIHRIGELHPGDQIVFVGVSSTHRGDAFDACEYIIDYLKTRATFWKREDGPDGHRWLQARQSDIESAEEWRENDAE